MKVHDLLKRIDIGKIASCLATRRDYGDGFEIPSESEMSDILEAFVRSLIEIEPYEESEYIIIPAQCIEHGEEGISAMLYRKSDIVSFRPNLTMGEMECNAARAGECEMEELPRLLTADLPENYEYAFSPWKETLSHGIFLPNEDADFIAAFAEDILWKMSFNGYTEETQEKRRQKLIEAIENGQQAIEEGRCRSADEFLDEMRERYGIRDSRTPEEKESDKRSMYRNIIENQIAITCSLLACQAAMLAKAR